MLGLMLAGALIVCRQAAVFGWSLADPVHTGHTQLLYAGVLLGVALVVALGLILRWRGVRWFAAGLCAVWVLLGLISLGLDQVLVFRSVSAAPRSMIVWISFHMATSLAALIVLLLPSTATAWRGHSSAGGLEWQAPALACLAVFVVVGLVGWRVLGSYPILVHDEAGVLDMSERADLVEIHGHLRQNFDIDYRVIIAGSVGDIDRYAVGRYRALEVGSASSEGRGLLLVLDPDADQVRLEVGYALEAIYVDAFVDYIQRNQMTAFFAAGRIADGIQAATELIVTRAQHAANDLGYADEFWAAGSGGGGARNPARLNAGPNKKRSERPGVLPAADRPTEVLAAYGVAMSRGNDNPDLAIYSNATRRKMRKWVVTRAQMASVAKALDRCEIEDTQQLGDRAVVRAPVLARTCPPYFFVREGGRWRLDLSPMQTVLRFNTKNQWRLDLAEISVYRFGFHDWMISDTGYPMGTLTRMPEPNAPRSTLYIHDGERTRAFRARH